MKQKLHLLHQISIIKRCNDICIYRNCSCTVGYVLVANMLDTTIKTAEEVEKQFKVPVLASIPLYNFEPAKSKEERKNNEIKKRINNTKRSKITCIRSI